MENTNTNPYQAPEAELDAPVESQNLSFGEPQKKPAGRGAQWIKSAFQLFKQSPGGWILTMIVGFIIMMVTNFIPVLGSLFTLLTTYIWTAGILHGSREVDRGNKFKVGFLFAGFKLAFGKLMGLSVIIGLIGFAIAILCMGTLYIDVITGEKTADQLFVNQDAISIILPILIMMALYIPLMMFVWFAPALIIFHDMPIFKAMKESFNGCLKNIVPFLIYGIVALLLMIVAMIPVGLGLLIMVPVLYASMYTAYKDIYLREASE